MQKIVRTAAPDLKHLKDGDKRALLKTSLLEMTKNHCAYTDRLIDGDLAVIDHFKPQNLGGDDVWENLYVVHPVTNQIKADNYHDLLIRPDEPDYDFDRYFDLDFDNHTIKINRSANEKDQVRAGITITTFNLNHPDLVKEREYALKEYLKKVERRRRFEEDMLNIDEQKSSNSFREEGERYSIKESDKFGFESNNYPFRFYVERALEQYKVEKNEYVDTIKIGKYFCIEQFMINGLGEKKEIYFLGENGDGKTIVLQAIILALRGLFDNFIHKYIDTSDSNFDIEIQDAEWHNYKYNYGIGAFNTAVYAYGVSRLRENDRYDDTGYLSLFDHKNISLINPVRWFEKVELLEGRGTGKLKLETVKELFNKLIGENIKIEILEGEYVFKEKDSILKFSQLSDGYRSIMIWLSDLLSRLSKNQPEVTKLEDYKAIVLVDEIGSYLHPRWEYTVVRKLRKLFPKIQWFFTTHSPVVALGASEDAVFYKLYKEDGTTKVSEPYNASTYANRLLSNFVTSPLFNLDTARSAAFQGNEYELETGDYLYTRIHKVVKERSKGKPLQDTEIQDMISELLDNLEKEGKI